MKTTIIHSLMMFPRIRPTNAIASIPLEATVKLGKEAEDYLDPSMQATKRRKCERWNSTWPLSGAGCLVLYPPSVKRRRCVTQGREDIIVLPSLRSVPLTLSWWQTPLKAASARQQTQSVKRERGVTWMKRFAHLWLNVRHLRVDL